MVITASGAETSSHSFLYHPEIYNTQRVVIGENRSEAQPDKLI